MTVPEPPHADGIDQAGVSRRFVDLTTARTHAPEVAVRADNQSSMRMPCLVVEASGGPLD